MRRPIFFTFQSPRWDSGGTSTRSVLGRPAKNNKPANLRVVHPPPTAHAHRPPHLTLRSLPTQSDLSLTDILLQQQQQRRQRRRHSGDDSSNGRSRYARHVAKDVGAEHGRGGRVVPPCGSGCCVLRRVSLRVGNKIVFWGPSSVDKPFRYYLHRLCAG